MGAAVVGGAKIFAAGQMDRRPQRGIRQCHAGPGHPYPGAPGARQRGPFPGARCRSGGRPRRLSVRGGAGRLDAGVADGDGGRLCHTDHLHGIPRRLHQYGPDRRLSRRRQARSQLHHRTADRGGGAALWVRSGGIATPECGGRLPLRDGAGPDLRLRALPAQYRRYRAPGRPRWVRGPPRGVPACRQTPRTGYLKLS